MSCGRPIRVLVVDDSAFMRKMVSTILTRGGLEVAGIAGDGMQALEKVRELVPDVITLDVEMPRMTGVEFLRELMKQRPTPVVVLSSLADAGADTTIQCLELGAVECIHKPSGAISLDLDNIGGTIVQSVKRAAMANRGSLSPTVASTAAVRTACRSPLGGVGGSALGRSDAVVVIASSTGGPSALNEVVTQLPEDITASVLIVQHLPVGFTKSLAARLDARSALTVREAQDGEDIRRGVALVAPAGTHMEVTSGGCVRMTADPPMWGVRPAADITMRSAADQYRWRTMGIVLTGMGRDGALGARAIKEGGGLCIAQDEATSVVWGMPRAALEAGATDRMVPLGQMARIIVGAVRELCSKGYRTDGRDAVYDCLGAR